MRRLLRLLAIFLLTGDARAGVQDILPIYPTGEAQQTLPGAQTLVCGRFVKNTTLTGLTNTTINVTTGFGVAKAIGWAIYPDLDAGTAIMSVGNVSAAVAAPSAVTVSAFDLTGGVTYRLCVCASGTAGAYAAPKWTPTTGMAALLNAFVASVGTAANSCDASANPPATTGAITPDNTLAPPLVVVQ